MAELKDAGFEMLLYLIFVGLIQLAATLVLALAALPLSTARGWISYRAFVAKLSVLSLAVYLWGCLGAGAFASIFRGRIYVNPDPIADFVPWLPSVRLMVDTVCGGHLLGGATWNTLRLAWLATAIPVWALALWTSFAAWKRLTWCRPLSTGPQSAS